MAIAEDDFVVGGEVDNLKLNVDPFHFTASAQLLKDDPFVYFLILRKGFTANRRHISLVKS